MKEYEKCGKGKKIMKMREANQRSLENQTDGLVRTELLVRALHPYEQHYEPTKNSLLSSGEERGETAVFAG